MSTRETTLHDGSSKKTLKAYVIGFILCVILTVIPFFIVANHSFSAKALYLALAVFAVLQLFVQVTFFLRLNASAEGRWNLMPFLFSIFVVIVLVGGSFWIMYNLNYNMMH
jgi:cytochrome o ubiquinol oxidase subunit IV